MPVAIAEEDAAERASWSAGWFDTLLRKLPTAAYTCDAAGLITWYNDAARELWGRRPALNDPADRYCGSFKLFTPGNQPIDHASCWMARALAEDREYRGCEIVVERPDGTRRTALAHATPIHDASNHLLGAVNVLVDITAHKETERALREQADVLHGLDTALHAKVEQLAEADRRKDEFLAQLAHELRNPLSPILTSLRSLRLRDIDSPEQAVLERQANHLARLTDDLLDMSRITRGKLRVERRPLDLEQAVHAAIEATRPLFERCGHVLTVTLPPHPAYVEGDSIRLTQVVTNLLTNAAKFTDPRGHVTLSLERHGTDVLLRIQDSGIGIASADLPRLFEMFYQADHGDRARSGLGVGLALVRHLVELHGGRVTAESAGPGLGSSFTVSLPARAPLTTHAGRPTSAKPHRGRYRVLVADDNADSADSLAALLELMGHDVHLAYDGAAALRIAAEEHPDLALLDLGMPVLDGYETCRRLRQAPWGAELFVVALTGWGRRQDRDRSKAAGFDAHLVKPLDSAKLESALHSFERHRHAAALAESEA